MDPNAFKLVVVATMVGGAALWVLSTFLFRMSGTWERVLTEQDIEDGVRKERITLAQLGPFVTGRRDVRGGYQEYSGIAYGRRLTLTRRDHGPEALAALGFPEAIAKKLNGEVMARMKLTLVDGVELRGSFEPHKIEFTHQPPRVTSMYFLPPKSRVYRKLQPIEEAAPAMAEPEIEG